MAHKKTTNLFNKNHISLIKVENDNLEFDNISVLNKIADKIDYSRVLGLNSTVITINSRN